MPRHASQQMLPICTHFEEEQLLVFIEVQGCIYVSRDVGQAFREAAVKLEVGVSPHFVPFDKPCGMKDKRACSNPATVPTTLWNTSSTFKKIGLSSPLGVHSGVETPRQLLPERRDQDRRVVAKIRHGPHMLTTENVRLAQGACSDMVKENRELSASFRFRKPSVSCEDLLPSITASGVAVQGSEAAPTAPWTVGCGFLDGGVLSGFPEVGQEHFELPGAPHNLKVSYFSAYYHIEPGCLGCRQGAAWGRCGNHHTQATSVHHGAESESDRERGQSHGLQQSSSWCQIWSPLSRLRPHQSAQCLTLGRRHGLKHDLKSKQRL